jgi:hypothetical protein
MQGKYKILREKSIFRILCHEYLHWMVKFTLRYRVSAHTSHNFSHFLDSKILDFYGSESKHRSLTGNGAKIHFVSEKGLKNPVTPPPTYGLILDTVTRIDKRMQTNE